ncbi:hypothetical protein [Burkholderia gladioli]|uniref:hypothetical protein n=1 Tax=Burkholderia gladioli TaxID=28095 RepID=UPI00164163BC|nr:hypothetical protein [Burkholderia gladioli]
MFATVAKGHAAAGKTPADQAALTDYWTNMLTLAADAQVDSTARKQLANYEAQLTQAAQASGNTQAMDTFMQNLATAQREVSQMAGFTISGVTGTILADGSVVKTFQASGVQFRDSSLFGTLGGTTRTAAIDSQYYVAPNGPTLQQVAGFAQDQIAKVWTAKGAVTPDYSIESLLSGATEGKIVSGILDAVFGTGVEGAVQATTGGKAAIVSDGAGGTVGVPNIHIFMNIISIFLFGGVSALLSNFLGCRLIL